MAPQYKKELVEVGRGTVLEHVVICSAVAAIIVLQLAGKHLLAECVISNLLSIFVIVSLLRQPRPSTVQVRRWLRDAWIGGTVVVMVAAWLAFGLAAFLAVLLVATVVTIVDLERRSSA